MLQKVTIFLIFTVSLTAYTLTPVLADSLDMYEKGTARTVFSPQMHVVVAGMEAPAEDKLQDSTISQDKIVAEFGNPDEDFPVTAVKDAPKPYKGMVAALQAGDRELAYKYSRQYVKYVADVKAVTSETVGLMGVGMLAEGELTDDSWVQNPEYAKFREEYEKLFPEKANPSAKVSDGELDQAALQLLSAETSAESSENSLFSGSAIIKGQQALKDREAARKAFATNSFKVPQGQPLELFFFFKTTDQKSINQGQAISFLAKELAPKNVKITNLSTTYTTGPLLERFRKITNLSSAINGDKLAAGLSVSATPTVMLVNPANSQFIKIENLVSAEYLDELLIMIREVQ